VDGGLWLKVLVARYGEEGDGLWRGDWFQLGGEIWWGFAEEV